MVALANYISRNNNKVEKKIKAQALTCSYIFTAYTLNKLKLPFGVLVLHTLNWGSHNLSTYGLTINFAYPSVYRYITLKLPLSASC